MSDEPVKRIGRIGVGLAALILGLGSVAHFGMSPRVFGALAASNLAAYEADGFRVLWLSDATTHMILAAVLGFIAVKPRAASRWVIFLVALAPLPTAVLLYTYLGVYIGGDILVVVAVLACAGGWHYPRAC